MAARDREVFEHVLLGFLVEAPAHGYDLAAHFEPGGDLADVGRLGKSQLYALLNGLETRGAARSELHPESGGPARRVFSATDAGRRRFLAWLCRPVGSLRRLRLEFVFKLYFQRRRSPSGEQELLGTQKALLQRQLEGLRPTAALRPGVAADLVALRRHLLTAALRWVSDEQRRAAGPPAAEAPGADS